MADRQRLSPEERSLRARIAAHTRHARHDPRESTAPARAAFFDRFLKEADPDGRLPEPERVRRAEHLMQAHMYRLALRSARARRAAKAAS